MIAMRLYEKTKNFLGLSGRFNPRRAAARIPACHVRRITPADFGTCIDIYRRNESGHVPIGFLSEFEQSLYNEHCHWLGIEADGELVGTGGIQLVAGAQPGALLVFGSIRPDRHRMGYGSTLLLARIAALPQPQPSWYVVMTSLAKSVRFFRNYGFGYLKRLPDDDGNEWDNYCTKVSLRAWVESRAILAASDAAIESGALAMPATV